jgi:hypothetical protein
MPHIAGFGRIINKESTKLSQVLVHFAISSTLKA